MLSLHIRHLNVPCCSDLPHPQSAALPAFPFIFVGTASSLICQVRNINMSSFSLSLSHMGLGMKFF